MTNGGHGGGIYSANYSGTITLTNCTITGNSTQAFGGGVYSYNVGGTISVTNCTITGNSAQSEGGGICNFNSNGGTISVTNCTITGNSTQTYGHGGGIENSNYNGGTITTTNCAIAGNTAQYGGGIANSNQSGGTIAVTNCTLVGNTATSNGGGIDNNGDGTITVTNCTTIGNTAQNVGGIYNFSNAGAITLTNDIVYGDFGGEVGVGGGLCTASDCDIQGGYMGTGNINANPLFFNPPSDLHLQPSSPCLGAGTASGAPSQTIDGKTRPNPPSIGAYEEQPQATTTLISSMNPSVSGNSVTFDANVFGGAGSVSATGTVTFIVDGIALTPVPLGQYIGTERVGIAYYTTSSLAVGSHTVTASYSGDGNYGPSMSSVLTQVVNAHISPLYVAPSGSDGNPGTQAAPKLTIQAAINAAVSGDTVLVEDGTYSGPGDIDLDFWGRNITVTSQHGPTATTIDCGASSGHRGFYLHYGETNAVISGLTIQNGTNTNGLAPGGLYGGGGGIYNANASLTVQNCVIRNNVDSDYSNGGGGIYNSGTLTLSRCLMAGNSSEFGGAVENYGGMLTMTNCLFTGNSSDYGAALYAYNQTGGVAAVTNCTLIGNSALNGNVVESYGGATVAVSLTNDIVYGNTGGAVSTSSPVTASYCDIQGGYAGTGNINADPLFFNAASGDFRLQPGSPCLGAGTANGAPATDINGLTRPNPPSIGAYDFFPVASQTALTSSLNPSTAGQSVTFTAAVTAGSGSAVPTGAVQFAIDGTNVGSPVTLDSTGKAVYATTSLTVGTHSVTAAYIPTGGLTASTSSALTQTVTAGSTTTALTSSLNPSVYGQNVTFTATVAGAGATPTGTVTFALDGTAQTPVVLTAGQATFTTSSLSVGSHTLTAAYSGDGRNLASTSFALTQTVSPLATTTALTSSLNPAKAGQAIVFNAFVGGHSPTGTVMFFDGGTMLGTGTLANGSAYFTTSALSAGTHPITASYGGDGVNAPSQSQALSQTVTALPGTTLTVSSLIGANGQTVTLSATLKLAGGAALSGKTLTFSVDGTSVGTGVTNSAGTATKTYVIPASLTVGSHTITVSFAGDSSDGASSGTGTLTVTPANTTLSVSAVSGFPGQSLTLKATLKRTVGGAALVGATVSFSVDGTVVGIAVTASGGLASLTYVVPTGGAIGSSHPITAAFAGDSGDSASSGSASLTVSKYGTTLGVVAVTGVPGQTVTLSATLKRASGGASVSGESVTFSVDGAAVGTATTNASGIATLSYMVPLGATIGSHSITAAFAGDATYLTSTGNGTLTVKYATTLTVANASGARGTNVTLTATLTQTSGGAVVSGKTITFKVDGKPAGTAVTNGSGVASLTYAISATATVGSHALSDSFAGDSTYNTATGTGTLTVN